LRRLSVFRRGSDEGQNVDDTRTQSAIAFRLFLDLETACWFSHLQEKQIPDNNMVRFAGIWRSACTTHIADQ
jgi:hypothetical protein